ncbi:Retrovirus-related Pol polyprotein from transposon 17.6 [Araneus ventricosus]|uniref:Retrovirus-related Pol polyprotein from transposon 17.6 n=1 Tax=Araneus ventricosus TaxID=182803 RepID=A0A4Y2DI28_ARAVE|nr:Retrovirus-related Pol polyprotein from transposon 17.6 [Araneus ventricosus]
MLKHKIIEIEDSDYNSPMILVEVAGKDPRPCNDYRKLNKITKTQFFPLQNVEQRVETVAAAKYKSVLDLTKGYWQIPLPPDAQRIATFITSFGTFRPLRMPFGLKNAPFTFSKMMVDIFNGCDHFAVLHSDDVAIYSNSWEEHLSHLNAVMSKIKHAGLTIKPIKCKFAQDRVKYLGHIVARGIRTPNEVKVKAVLDFPVQTTKSQVRAFLGLAGYYNHYIPMFSSIVAPLIGTLKGKLRQGKINCTEECTRAFKELKDKLS